MIQFPRQPSYALETIRTLFLAVQSILLGFWWLLALSKNKIYAAAAAVPTYHHFQMHVVCL